jgi:hypothetical protein
MPDRVKVKSSTGQAVYTVARGADGRWACECLAFGFSKERTCKHVRWVAMAQLLVARCCAAHGPGRDGVCVTCLTELVGRALTRNEKKRRRRGTV